MMNHITRWIFLIAVAAGAFLGYILPAHSVQAQEEVLACTS